MDTYLYTNIQNILLNQQTYNSDCIWREANVVTLMFYFFKKVIEYAYFWNLNRHIHLERCETGYFYIEEMWVNFSFLLFYILNILKTK